MTDLTEELGGGLRKREKHDHSNICMFDVFQYVLDDGHRVPVDGDDPLVCHTDTLLLGQLGELLLALTSVLIFTGHHCHPVPPKLRKKLHQRLHLPPVCWHGTHEGWVQLLVAELVTGGSEADLIEGSKICMMKQGLQFSLEIH